MIVLNGLFRNWMLWLLVCSLLAMLLPMSGRGTAAGAAVLIDDLTDWSKVYDRSDSLSLRSFPDYPEEDPTRAVPGGSGREYVTYRTKDPLRSFAVSAYYSPAGGRHGHPSLYVSPDGITYSPVTASVYENGGYLQAVSYEANQLPPDVHYLQIRYNARSAGEPPTLGKVVLNGPGSVQASLPGGLVPYGSKVVLRSETPGVTIYYTTDGSDPRSSRTRRHYGGPIDVLDYMELRTCAVLTGTAASRVSLYRYVPLPAEDEGRIGQAFEDGFVDSGVPQAVYGQTNTLLLKKFRSREAYLKFRLPEVIGEGDTVTLQVYGYAADSSRQPAALKLYSVSPAWSEGTLTYANKPLTVTGSAYGAAPPSSVGVTVYGVSSPPSVEDEVYGQASSSTTEAVYGQQPVSGSSTVTGAAYDPAPSTVTGMTYGKLLDSLTLDYGPSGWLQFDITAYAREARQHGLTEISLALVNETDGMTFLGSRESGATAPFLLSSPQVKEGFTDGLETTGRIHSRSNVYLTGTDPAYYGGDTGRLARTSTAAGWVIYRSDEDIRSVTMTVYKYVAAGGDKFRLYGSKDGTVYVPIEAEAYGTNSSSGGWLGYLYEAVTAEEGIRYLKIELPASTDKPWASQLAEVTLNRSTASVQLSSTRTAGGLVAELSSAAPGAAVFYRLGEEQPYRRYSEPLLLTGFPKLQTYAVKDGLKPSPLRTYTLNASDAIKVDRFGQLGTNLFAGRVHSEQELRNDAAADEAYYGSLAPPEEWDRFGGLDGSAERFGLEATGYFAVGDAGGRKVLKTPEGNVFFSLGVNGLTNLETFTKVEGREEQFEWIPPSDGEYQQAFVPGDPGSFSYYMANKYRKTGQFPTSSALYTEAVGRLKDWGFNTAGSFSPEQYGSKNAFPYVRMLPLSWMDWARVPGLSLFDIFAPDAEQKIDATFASVLPQHENDEMLIGYFLDNEYDYHKFRREVPRLKGSRAAIKLKLVSELEAKYGTIAAFNTAWGTAFTSFEEAKEQELPLKSSASWHDMNAFFELYMDTFYGTVSRIYRKYDSNHLLLGDRWITTPFHDTKLREILAEASGKYMDVISINYYTRKLETDLLSEVHAKSGGKPILFSEFGYGTAEQGLKPLVPGAALNQNDRQLRYRNYVEGAASLSYVVGVHWFNYVDQAGTGRYWQGIGDWAERYNSGLLNVADRPYKTFLAGAMKSNYEIYQVMLGERPRFYYEFNSSTP
ncbi:hypothetical protein J2T17_005789 [Paenibacillus mucilaginosus]